MLRKIRIHITKFFALVPLLFFALTGCDYIQKHFGDGYKERVTKRNGLVKSYRPNKTLYIEANYVNDTLQGLYKSYYENGNVKKKMTMKSGKKHGLASLFYDNGNLRDEVNYRDGVKEGILKSYYKNGGLYKEVNYIEGLRQGNETKYHENGKVMSILPYKNNYPGIGLKEFNKSGKPLKIEPRLEVKTIDNLRSSGKYSIEVQFSKKRNKADYYLGELVEGQFLYEDMPKIIERDGAAYIDGSVPPGQFIMERLRIVGCFKTPYGNPYIITKRYNLALDNSF